MTLKVLVTGASGYVGSRLMARLAEQGYALRALARRPEFLQQKVVRGIELVKGDLLDATSLTGAFEGIDVAYYLVHGLSERKDFEALERRSAQNFVNEANRAGVKKIIYLGGLANATAKLSSHMQSRQAVGQLLRERSLCPVIEFQASIIIGAGSLSFEMIRALVERLPIMVTPRWVAVKAQPIFIDNVLEYLLAALHFDARQNEVLEIGGNDVVSYGDLMHAYAKAKGLKRWMIPVPFLTPRLSSYWLGLVTPLYARVGRRLIESINHPSVVTQDRARALLHVNPIGALEAFTIAMRRDEAQIVQSHWYNAVSASVPNGDHHVREGNRLIQINRLHTWASIENVYQVIDEIGGPKGWYFANFLWKLRALIDLLVGGVGFKRGRTRARNLQVGDVVDWWRVVLVNPNQSLGFEAEMKVPGRAWLRFDLRKSDEGGVEITQTAIFDPKGLLGLLYWYALYPVHIIVFHGLLRNLAKRARAKG
jgi:uncharacterized protein YbjT (DUF2867 family)